VSDWSQIRLWQASGGLPNTQIDNETFFIGFSPASDRLVAGGVYEPMQGDETVRVWSVPDGSPVRTIQFDTWAYLFFPIAGDRLVTMDTDADPGAPLATYTGDYLFQSWPLEGGEPTTLGRLSAEGGRGMTDTFLGYALDVDPGATRLAYAQDNELYVIPFEEMGSTPPRLLARHEHPIRWVTFHPDGNRLAFAAANGEIQILSLTEEGAPPLRVLHGTEDPALIVFDRRGSQLACITYGRAAVEVWDLEGPPDAHPLVVGRVGQPWYASFHPNGRWIATINAGQPAIWPLGGPQPRIFRHTAGLNKPVFAPDGSWIASAGAGAEVLLWPLNGDSGGQGRVLFRGPPVEIGQLAVDPQGQHLLFTAFDHRPRLLSLQDGRVRELHDAEWFSGAVAFGPRGRLAAVGGGWQDSMPEHAVIRVWDLDTDEVRVLDAGDGMAIRDLEFLPDLRLLSSGLGGLRLWDPESGTHELLREERSGEIDLSPDGRTLLIVGKGGTVHVHDLETGASHVLDTGGRAAGSIAFDPSGTIVVAGHGDGSVSVGRLIGGDRHLLLGHQGGCEVAVSPDGRWIASAGGADATVRLWEMPDLTRPPIHSLPIEELLERLRAQTNLRVVLDETTESGYRLDVEPFPGWETAPTW
jgi:WD40 repeat protein